MNEIVEFKLDEACLEQGLSPETCKVIKALLKKKINDEIANADLSNELARIYELIKGDIDED